MVSWQRDARYKERERGSRGGAQTTRTAGSNTAPLVGPCNNNWITCCRKRPARQLDQVRSPLTTKWMCGVEQ